MPTTRKTNTTKSTTAITAYHVGALLKSECKLTDAPQNETMFDLGLSNEQIDKQSILKHLPK